MFNLFDILQNQSGPGFYSLGQQFGLSPEQSRKAMEALLPALAMGLQRNAATDPMGVARMFGLMGAQPQPEPPRFGSEALLDQLFGSPALSQAILQQAAAVSGIATPALKQMLPVMAGMVVAGIVHVMLNQQDDRRFFEVNERPKPTPQPTSPTALWDEWFKAMTPLMMSSAEMMSPAASTPAPSAKPAPAAPVNRPPPPIEIKPPVPKPDDPEAAPDLAAQQQATFEAMQGLFQTGVEAQEQNVKAMQDIFDSYWSQPAKTDETTEVIAPAMKAAPTKTAIKPKKAAAARPSRSQSAPKMKPTAKTS